MSHNHDMNIPKPLLMALIALVLSVTGFVGFSQATGIGHAKLEAEPNVERLAVLFRDEPGGGVGAYRAEDNRQLLMFSSGEGGFVRTALRSLTLHRRKENVSSAIPFELMRSASGNVILLDPATGKTITLIAFGNTNQNDFAQLFDIEAGRQTQ